MSARHRDIWDLRAGILLTDVRAEALELGNEVDGGCIGDGADARSGDGGGSDEAGDDRLGDETHGDELEHLVFRSGGLLSVS